MILYVSSMDRRTEIARNPEIDATPRTVMAAEAAEKFLEGRESSLPGFYGRKVQEGYQIASAVKEDVESYSIEGMLEE